MSKLKVNVDKTKFMVVGKRNDAHGLELRMNNQCLQQVGVMKYLGVMIDQKMTFKENAEFVKKKVAKKALFMSRMRKNLDKDIKLLLYKTLMQPHSIIVAVYCFYLQMRC